MNAAADKNLFSVDEANRRLPLIRSIVQDIVDLSRDVHQRRERLAEIDQLPGASQRREESLYSEEVRQMRDNIDSDMRRLVEFAGELEELGVELKDPLRGLVDFRSVIDGREVYLCWKLGEEEITYWHELDAGFQGRQPLYEGSVPGDSGGEEEQN